MDKKINEGQRSLSAARLQEGAARSFFTLDELTRSATARALGIDNRPRQQSTLQALKRLTANVLNPAREWLGMPILVTSGFRSRLLNDHLKGSSPRSQHLTGEAADLVVSQHAMEALGSRLRQDEATASLAVAMALTLPQGWDQIILEDYLFDGAHGVAGCGWVHVSYATAATNRRQLLLKRKGGRGYSSPIVWSEREADRLLPEWRLLWQNALDLRALALGRPSLFPSAVWVDANLNPVTAE